MDKSCILCRRPFYFNNDDDMPHPDTTRAIRRAMLDIEGYQDQRFQNIRETLVFRVGIPESILENSYGVICHAGWGRPPLVSWSLANLALHKLMKSFPILPALVEELFFLRPSLHPTIYYSITFEDEDPPY